MRFTLWALLGCVLASALGGCDADRPVPTPARAPVSPPTQPPAGLTKVAWGQRLFQDHGCAGCHHINGIRGVGRPLDGLYDAARSVGDGGTARIGEDYLRRAVVHAPDAVRAPEGTPMPSYEDQLDRAEIDALVAYLKSLARRT